MSDIEEKTKTWITEHWQGTHNCPICGGLSWAPPENIYILQSTLSPNRIYNNIPVVYVACTTCGYTMTFSAIIIGLKI